MRNTLTSFLAFVKKAIVVALVLLLLLFSIISLSAYVDKYIFICQLLAHLKLVWLAIIAVLTACLLVARRPKWALVGAIVWTIDFASVGLLYLPRQLSDAPIMRAAKTNAISLATPTTEKRTPSEQVLRLFISNVWGGSNKDYAKTCKVIRQNAPDVFELSEVTPDWIDALKKSLPEYKYLIAEPQYGGIAMFSRFPIQEGLVKHYGLNPRIEAVVRCNSSGGTENCASDVLIICAHPCVPMTPEELRLRNGELDEIAKTVASTNMPSVVCGDMNCTPFSSYFQRFEKNSGLLDTEQGFGVQPTWNAFMPLPVIPIDHCFASAAFKTRERYLTERTGADHFPVFVELVRNI